MDDERVEKTVIDLRLGDCLEILPTLSGPVDAIITDLPYGTTACSWDVVIPFAPMWEQVKRLLKPNGAFVTTASQPFTSMLVMSNLAWFRHDWVWDKRRVTGGANSDNAPMKAHESVLVFSKVAPVYNPQMTRWKLDEVLRKRRHDFYVTPKSDMEYAQHISPGRAKQVESGRHPDSVLRIPALGSMDSERTGHPTQKSLALYKYLILTYTNPGDTVLDFCFGSGTTGEACVRTGRNFVGIELKPAYFEIAKRRIEEAQLQMVMPLVTA